MPSVLQKIKPLFVELIAPEGAEFVGNTPTGLPIYRQTITRAGPKEPVIDPATGQQVWELHPTTAKPMYPRWRKRAVTRTRLIVPNQQGNGNLSWDEYTPPTPEQIAAQEREKKIEAMKDRLAGALVDSGLEPEELLASVRDAAPGTAEADLYPRHIGGPLWELSNGERFKGKKAEAIEAQAALKPAPAATSRAESTPEY